MDETPTKLFLETSLPTSASPYPSPSSAFYPPPIPASHEFANKLTSNKRYRGSGGAAAAAASAVATSAAGMTGPNGTAVTNSLATPSSANSSRRGSASAPSPLATQQPLVAHHLDGMISSALAVSADSESMAKGSALSGSASTSFASATSPSPRAAAFSPTTPKPASLKAGVTGVNGDSTALHDRIATSAQADATSMPAISEHSTPSNPPAPASAAAAEIASTMANTDPSTPPRPTPTLATTTISTTTSPSSKRTSQILEILTPTRAAPPSPGPSRRGSLIRRGSSRRWSATNSASGGTPGLAPGIADDGYFGGPDISAEPKVIGSGATTTSKRASKRLSAFNPLASTVEGQVASFSEPTPIAGIPGAGAGAGPDTSTPMPSSAFKTDAGVITDETTGITSNSKPEDGIQSGSLESVDPNGAGAAGASPCKPILVADFAFAEDDPRFSTRPLQLLTAAERAELGPEASAGGVERNMDDDEDDDDEWGWLSRARPKGGDGEGEGEEEMTPRFGYSYGEDSSGSAGASQVYTNGVSTSTTGAGDSSMAANENELDPDSPLPPGIYRALYAFEAEGTAEMSLFEGQLVRVVGRGGGVGWAVAERGWRPENAGGGEPRGPLPLEGVGRKGAGEGDGLASEDETTGALGMAGQALVPEGYLEIWMLDGEEEWDHDGGGGGDANAGEDGYP